MSEASGKGLSEMRNMAKASPSKVSTIFHQPDLPLMEGEDSDLVREAEAVAGPAWIDRPNSHLGGDIPRRVIEQGRGAAVRDLLRTIKYIGFS
jgi:hypothetical protein